jgi:predicted Zn-dependent protease
MRKTSWSAVSCLQSIVIAVALVSIGAPAHAQLGGLLDKAQKARDAKAKLDDLNVSDEEERKIGEDVSTKIRTRFGVVQNNDIHKYVTLVGRSLTDQSERPKLEWTFVVLDTDGVNAFASPGGIVHVTRGALGLMRNEAELAGVLAHEISHVTRKHTVNAIKKNKAVQLGTSETLSDRGPFLDKIANKAYEMVLENAFDRGDELDADKTGVDLAQKAGYSAAGLADFLARLDERNKDQPARNGLFASHPETKERIDKVRQLAASKTGATVDARYKANVKYEPTPLTTIAVVDEGAAGLTGSTKPAEAKKEEEPKKKGFSLASLKKDTGPETKTAQVSASGGARGVGPDRAAKGGSNPAIVKVTASDADVAAFKKGVA